MASARVSPDLLAVQLQGLRTDHQNTEDEMNQALVNGPWIVAQLIRIRALEREVRDLLAIGGTPGASLRNRVAQLNSQVALLDLALSE
jgi:hypothetical protein